MMKTVNSMKATLVASLLLARLAWAYPADTVLLEARQSAGTCTGQSCLVATVAGSTGATSYPYSTYPTGDTQDGDCCIIRYFPAAKSRIYQARPGLQAYCATHGGDAPLDSNPPGVTSINRREAEAEPEPEIEAPTPERRAACKPNILIFVKGTFEPFTLGVTLGPQLALQLGPTWDVRGVDYDNSADNDYCLGLPGNKNARQVLAQAVSDCPKAKIALSGYSQGAMVVRNAIARAPAANVARIKNVVNFGDPFNGANIGQYSGPRTVFCQKGDGVCNGQFDISTAHLSYSGNVSAAVKILNSS